MAESLRIQFACAVRASPRSQGWLASTQPFQQSKDLFGGGKDRVGAPGETDCPAAGFVLAGLGYWIGGISALSACSLCVRRAIITRGRSLCRGTKKAKTEDLPI